MPGILVSGTNGSGNYPESFFKVQCHLCAITRLFPLLKGIMNLRATFVAEKNIRINSEMLFPGASQCSAWWYTSTILGLWYLFYYQIKPSKLYKTKFSALHEVL